MCPRPTECSRDERKAPCGPGSPVILPYKPSAACQAIRALSRRRPRHHLCPPGQQYHSRTHLAWLLYSETKMISKSKNEPATGAVNLNAESQTPENSYMPPEIQSPAKSATTASAVSSRMDATGADPLLRNWDALSARLLCSACT